MSAPRFDAPPLFAVDTLTDRAGSSANGCTPRQRAAIVLVVIAEATGQRVYVGDPGEATALRRGPVVWTLRLNPQTADALERRELLEVNRSTGTMRASAFGVAAVVGWVARGLV